MRPNLGTRVNTITTYTGYKELLLHRLKLYTLTIVMTLYQTNKTKSTLYTYVLTLTHIAYGDAIINPRSRRGQRVIVVRLSVCLFVCLFVCNI